MDVVALYAAIVATGAAVIQFVVWRSSETRLTLKVKPGTAPLLDGVPGETIFVTVINHSSHGVKLMGLSFETEDGKTLVTTHPFPAMKPFPYALAARDQLVFWVNRNGFDASDGPIAVVRAAVWTATDQMFKSKRQPVDDVSRWEVAEVESVFTD